MIPTKIKTNWLPEVVTLKLTALEAGYLAAVIYADKKYGHPVLIMKPGPNGEPIPISMADRLLEKLNEEIKQFYPREK